MILPEYPPEIQEAVDRIEASLLAGLDQFVGQPILIPLTQAMENWADSHVPLPEGWRWIATVDGEIVRMSPSCWL
jgi:hypothetical protein